MKIHISRNGQTYGPYSINSVKSFLENGRLSPTDLAWIQGEEEWRRLENLLGEEPNSEKDSSKKYNLEVTLEKIKTLIENDESDFALDLVKGMDDQDLIIELLKDCKIDENEGRIELPDWMNGANGFFLELLQELPEEFEPKSEFTIVPLKVKKLNLSMVEDFKSLENLKIFGNLESLELSSMDSLSDIELLKNFTKLTVFKMRSCDLLDSMDSISPIQNCKNLSELELNSFDFIENLDFLSEHKNLTKLQVSSLKLTDLGGVKDLKKIEGLDLDGCSSLIEVEQIKNLDQLTDLNFGMCEKIENLDFLIHLKNLTKVNLQGCSGIEKIPSLDDLNNLRELNLNSTSISKEDCVKLENLEQLMHLTFPNGSEIERFTNKDEPGGTLPRIEFYLGGYGLEAHEGSLTEEQYEYWKDKSESELIEHCDGWDEEDDDIPENARLRSWYEMDDISCNNGCQDGTLEVTEYREWKDGWQKKYQTFAIEGGDSRDDDVKVNWIEPDREAPTGPSFQGYSSEKGMYCNDTIEGKTFDPLKLALDSQPVFGGAQGDAINSIYYDEQTLEFCPEADSKGYYFEILPAPEKE